MIPKAFRLTLNSKHPFIGQKHRGHWVTVISVTNTQVSWAIRVSNKIDKRSTHRNQLRRQLNHWLYRERANLKSIQFLVILQRKPSPADLPTLFEELKTCLYTNHRGPITRD